MDNLNFEHGKKWKDTDMGIRLHGDIGPEFVIRPNGTLRIIHKRKDDIYDVYDMPSGEWLFSRSSADNVFEELSKYQFVTIEFIDEVYP